MYKKYWVVYSKIVENKLDNFIDFMWDNCRYRDSWLYNEDIIVENYIKDIKLFVREIKLSLEEKISKWFFWEIQLENEDIINTKLIIFIRSYNIKCDCNIWKHKNLITVEDIFIRT